MVTVKRICPSCKTMVDIKYYKPEHENFYVTCPKCTYKSKLSNWASPNVFPIGTQGGAGETIITIDDPYITPGKLKVSATGQEFQLRMGEQLIGRKSPTGTADFQIGTAQNTDEYMSRKAASIEVKKQGSGVVVLLKEIGSVNAIILNGIQLSKGDVVELKPNDIFVLGFTNVQYVVSDPYRTEVKV